MRASRVGSHTAKALAELGFLNAACGTAYKARFGTVHTRDVVLFTEDGSSWIGEVLVLFSHDGRDLLVAMPWLLLPSAGAPQHTLRMDTTSRGMRLCAARDMQVALAHTISADGVALVRLPPHARGLA